MSTLSNNLSFHICNIYPLFYELKKSVYYLYISCRKKAVDIRSAPSNAVPSHIFVPEIRHLILYFRSSHTNQTNHFYFEACSMIIPPSFICQAKQKGISVSSHFSRFSAGFSNILLPFLEY